MIWKHDFLGFLARLIGLPPLVGFLATGFVLNYLGFASGEMLQKLADLGITLLLFYSADSFQTAGTDFPVIDSEPH